MHFPLTYDGFKEEFMTFRSCLSGKKKKTNDEYAVLPPIKDAAIPVEAHVKYVML